MADNTHLEEEITRLVQREVGETEPALVRSVVAEVLKAVTSRPQGTATAQTPPGLDISDCVKCRVRAQPETQTRGVITVTGPNKTGVVARFSGMISEYNVDILDISQTIVGGFFTMIIIVDLNTLSRGPTQHTFNDLKQRLLALGRTLGVQVIAVHEEIFRGMQRI